MNSILELEAYGVTYTVKVNQHMEHELWCYSHFVRLLNEFEVSLLEAAFHKGQLALPLYMDW